MSTTVLLQHFLIALFFVLYKFSKNQLKVETLVVLLGSLNTLLKFLPRPNPLKVDSKRRNHLNEASRSTLNSLESIWPTPFSAGVYQNEESSPAGQRDKEISLSQFISSLFDGVGQLLPGDFASLLLAAGDSCCQKVLQKFSRSIQGGRQQNLNYS